MHIRELQDGTFENISFTFAGGIIFYIYRDNTIDSYIGISHTNPERKSKEKQIMKIKAMVKCFKAIIWQ